MRRTTSRSDPVGRVARLFPLAALAGCGLLFPEAPLPGSPGSAAAPPQSSAQVDAPPPPPAAGTGTLLQEEISITLRRGELTVRVTPLANEITRVTAPDTRERLSALSRGYQAVFLERTGSAVPFQLFLVTLYTEAPELAFDPEGLNLVSRGVRYRPVAIHPVTPEWDAHRVRARQNTMAVYAFPGEMDLERELEVEYQEVRSREWDLIHPRIQSERARLGDGLP